MHMHGAGDARMSARFPQDHSSSADRIPQGRERGRLALLTDHAVVDLAIVRGALLRVEALGPSAVAVCGAVCAAVS